MKRLFNPAALVGVAIACWLAAVLAAPLGHPGYGHATHALAMRGAPGMPWAGFFNAFAFVLPGLLLAVAAVSMRPHLEGARWPARIGIWMLLLSGLAFAAQGVFPLDLTRPDEGDSKLHAMAWMLWWMGFVPGAALVGTGARRGAAFAAGSIVAAALVLGIGVLAPMGAWVGLVQKLVLAAALAWWWWAARLLSRA